MSTTNMTHHEEVAQHSAGRPTNFKHRLVRRFIGAAVGLVLAITSVGLTAPAAQAASAAYTIKSNISANSAPYTANSYSYYTTGFIGAGQKLKFDCWRSGGSVNGDTIWGAISAGQGYWGYIPDWYINLNGKRLNQIGIPQCGNNLPMEVKATVTHQVLIQGTPGKDNPNNGATIKGNVYVFNCYSTGPAVHGNTVYGHINGYWNGWLQQPTNKGYISDYDISLGGKTLKSMGLPHC